MCPRNCSCNILAKNVAAVCPCPKNLPEAKLKSFGLIASTEETSVVWLLVFTPMEIYNEREQEKEGTGKWNVVNPVFRKISRSKKFLMLFNGIKEQAVSGQSPTRLSSN